MLGLVREGGNCGCETQVIGKFSECGFTSHGIERNCVARPLSRWFMLWFSSCSTKEAANHSVLWMDSLLLDGVTQVLVDEFS